MTPSSASLAISSASRILKPAIFRSISPRTESRSVLDIFWYSPRKSSWISISFCKALPALSAASPHRRQSAESDQILGDDFLSSVGEVFFLGVVVFSSRFSKRIFQATDICIVSFSRISEYRLNLPAANDRVEPPSSISFALIRFQK